MWEAVVFGLLASSALAIGGALGSFWQAPIRVTGAMLAWPRSGALTARRRRPVPP